jgi:hypothetical protein
MTENADLPRAARQFMDDMGAVSTPARLDGTRILYDVIAVGGALAGQAVTTGVSISEVQSWPEVPPHWIHLADSVVFAQTNEDVVDCPPGWKRHSREYGHTDMSVPPALAWLRHVRGFISIAQSKAA